MLKDIIKKVGPAEIARQMQESLQTINNWKTRGIPLEKTVMFCAAVNFQITPHDLHPEQYPHPDDGLPASMRCKCESAAA